MTIDSAKIITVLDAIESEMRRIGIWSTQASLPEDIVPQAPFGHGQITFEQWIQYVLIPNARGLAESNGPYPSQSQVAAQAAREFSGFDEAEHLSSLLCDFDAIFNSDRC